MSRFVPVLVVCNRMTTTFQSLFTFFHRFSFFAVLLQAVTISANAWSNAGHAVNQLYDTLYMMGRDDIPVGVGGEGGIRHSCTILPNVGGYLPIIEQVWSRWISSSECIQLCWWPFLFAVAFNAIVVLAGCFDSWRLSVQTSHSQRTWRPIRQRQQLWFKKRTPSTGILSDMFYYTPQGYTFTVRPLGEICCGCAGKERICAAWAANCTTSDAWNNIRRSDHRVYHWNTYKLCHLSHEIPSSEEECWACICDGGWSEVREPHRLLSQECYILLHAQAVWGPWQHIHKLPE